MSFKTLRGDKSQQCMLIKHLLSLPKLLSYSPCPLPRSPRAGAHHPQLALGSKNRLWAFWLGEGDALTLSLLGLAWIFIKRSWTMFKASKTNIFSWFFSPDFFSPLIKQRLGKRNLTLNLFSLKYSSQMKRGAVKTRVYVDICVEISSFLSKLAYKGLRVDVWSLLVFSFKEIMVNDLNPLLNCMLVSLRRGWLPCARSKWTHMTCLITYVLTLNTNTQPYVYDEK